jgi:hypothetical protein
MIVSAKRSKAGLSVTVAWSRIDTDRPISAVSLRGPHRRKWIGHSRNGETAD